MIQTYIKQAWQVMKQNPFFSFISILSTAVTIAFVMVAYMVYDLNSSNLLPEINRNHLLYSDEARAYRTENYSNVNRGMSFRTAVKITENLPSAEMVSIHTSLLPYTCEAVGGEGSRARRKGRFVDAGWWIINEYSFVSGKPVTMEDFEAGLKIIVVTERVARELFNSTDVIGREVLINFDPYTICGVVKNVSPQFPTAFGEFWINISGNETMMESGSGSERVNGRCEFIAMAKSGKRSELKKELGRNVKIFSDSLLETTFEMKSKTHLEYTFTKIMDINPVIIYVLLACILLIVPAVNISGLISSMLDKRYEEIGIRKVYGASGKNVIHQFLSENFVLVVIGGLIGLILSFITLYFFRNWLLGISVEYISQIEMSWWMFFRPSVFLMALIFCLVFNMISTLIPVWYVSGRNIIQILKK